MAIKAPPPAESQPNPYTPSSVEPLLMEQFMGLNTNTTRPGVPDAQCRWLDGFFPIAPRNLRVLPGASAAIYTPNAPIVFFSFGNINAAPLMILILEDGSAWQLNTDTLVATIILPVATLISPSITSVGISQWGDQYIIIVSEQPNGYWLWDGTNVFTAGELSPVILLTSTGSGYTSAPTVTLVGGTGSGTSLVASIADGVVTGVSVINPGSGFLAGDNVSVVFTGGTTAGSGASVVITSLDVPSGQIKTASVVAGGSGYSNFPASSIPPAPFSPFLSGRLNLFVTSGTLTAASIAFGGGFYSDVAQAPVTITDNADVATATAELMPFGIQGSTVETYSGRVWVGHGATVFFTGPGSFASFATSVGGGNFTSVDSFLQIGFSRLISTNGFLYLIADSSINYISGVQTSGNPPTTTFTNQNADPQVGSPYPASVEVFGREVIFANAFGIHTCNGGAVTKVSEMLDGVYNTVANFQGIQLSSAQAIIFGKKVWVFLIRIVDPLTNEVVNKLFMSTGKKDQWWATEQDVTLSYIRHQEINSVITAWGTNGTSVYKLFVTPRDTFAKTVQSKLWDAPGGYQFIKAALRFWLMALYNDATSPNLVLTVDAIAEDGTVLADVHTLTPTGTGYFFPKLAVGNNGVLTGFTLRTLSPDMQLISVMMQDAVDGHRG